MICEECSEITNEYFTISNNIYCINCVNNYMLAKCPSFLCSNVISINGYNELNDIDNITCTLCDTVFCENCLVKAKNIIMCKDCFNS